MNVDILKLKTLAESALRDQHDSTALNDYGMAAMPTTVLELIAEIERHRQIEAEGCKPEISFEAIANAEDALSAAQQNLSNTIKRAFPVGSKLRVSIGTTTELVVAVTSHCSGWWRPGKFYAKNVETGKRQIYSHHQVLEVRHD
jgi:hypothetical protein